MRPCHKNGAGMRDDLETWGTLAPEDMPALRRKQDLGMAAVEAVKVIIAARGTLRLIGSR